MVRVVRVKPFTRNSTWHEWRSVIFCCELENVNFKIIFRGRETENWERFSVELITWKWTARTRKRNLKFWPDNLSAVPLLVIKMCYIIISLYLLDLSSLQTMVLDSKLFRHEQQIEILRLSFCSERGTCDGRPCVWGRQIATPFPPHTLYLSRVK